MVNLGKKFEDIIKRDFSAIPNTSITRLYDPTGGYSGIKNICDFIAYHTPNLFYIEAKETKENTFNLKRLTQYEDLLKYDNIKGLYPGVLIWFSSKNKVVWCSIKMIKWLYNNKFKSVNINDNSTYEFELDIDIRKKYPKLNIRNFLQKFTWD